MTPDHATELDLERIAARAHHMLGPAGQALDDDAALAWEGMIELHRRLRREAEALLDEHALSVSMLGITGRLALAPDHTLRQTALAQAMGLSLSRTSRVIDLLEAQELVVRRTCPSDARATNVELTAAGEERTARAQERLHALVQDAFFGRLSDDELATLAGVWRRLLAP